MIFSWIVVHWDGVIGYLNPGHVRFFISVQLGGMFG